MQVYNAGDAKRTKAELLRSIDSRAVLEGTLPKEKYAEA
jgi:hypothetical protein